jgi:hypothetical protein
MRWKNRVTQPRTGDDYKYGVALAPNANVRESIKDNFTALRSW